MLVIDQDSVEAVVIPEPRKRPEKVSRGRPLSENARKVQKIVENCFANSSYLNSVPVDTRYPSDSMRDFYLELFLDLKHAALFVVQLLMEKMEVQAVIFSSGLRTTCFSL